MVNHSIMPLEQEENILQNYREWRRAYYSRFPEFWGTLPGESVEEYAVYGALALSHEHASALRTASSRLYQVMTRLAVALQQADDRTFLDIGIPPATIPYCRCMMSEMPAVMCGRYEFAMTAAGPKLLEFNAETPTFVVELFHMNSQVCTDFGLIDPNVGCQEQLIQAIDRSIRAGLAWIEADQKAVPSVAFSAYAHRREERHTTEFYRNLLNTKNDLSYRTSFQGLDALRVTHDGLFTADGERIDVLYKLYPTEHLMQDVAPDGTPVGLLLMDLVRRRRLAVINPPIAFLLQCKALVAVLWALHQVQSPLFTDEEHLWIEQYVLPTYLDATDDQGQQLFDGPYVVKPVYGREGTSVTIRNKQEVVERSLEDFYNQQVMVYQQYCALPTTVIQTEQGRLDVNLVHNCFMVAGQPSAIGVRASRRLIFDDNAYFLPIYHPE